MVNPHKWLSLVFRGLPAIALCGLTGVAVAQDDTPSTPTFTVDIEGRSPASPAPSLLDAWLAVERESTVNWSRAFVVRDTLAVEEQQRRLRLEAELAGLALQSRLLAAPDIANGLEDWKDALGRLDQSRVPGRVDPTWLMAHLRDVPKIEDIDQIGWCQTPNWIEVWTLLGVKRLMWQPGMTTDSLLGQLPETAYVSADTLQWVSPQGDVRQIGIAAWNHEQASLAPGSRVTIALPLKSVGAQWVDMALPQFLATRLPGDECITVDPATLYQ